MGTTITVRDLFYNTPARMKFLKKDSSEGTFVAETVQRVALSHPEVSIAFVREGKRQFRTPGDGSLSGAVYTVLGREFARDLLAADASLGPYWVEGVITPPRACRASRGMQYFYINGRFVKNRTMMAAAEAAYKGTVMQGKFPGCVLRLTMPPELVDVNVHPAKTEVRFAREQEVFDAVYKAVRLALTAPGSGEQQLALDKEASAPATRGLAAIPAQKPQPAAAPVVQAAPAQVSAVRPAVPAAAATPAAPAVRGGAVFLAREQRGLRDIGRYHVRVRAEPTEGVAHVVPEAGVVAAVVGHGGVADDERALAGDEAVDLLQHALLRRRGQVAGVDAVEAYAQLMPVPGDGQHLVRQVPARPARELARVRAQQGGGDAGALHARGGDHGQRHRQRALAEAGDVVYGRYSLYPFDVFHVRYCITEAAARQGAGELWRPAPVQML